MSKFNLKNKITNFHYGNLFSLFTLLFFIPSIFYFLVISIKNFLYKTGILNEQKVNAFVICVGNLTTGGVGKTPVVIKIANYLSNKGYKVAILSRGYKGKFDDKIPLIVKTYNEILIDNVEITGDEVNLISKNANNSAVVVCKNRVKGANCAIEKLGAEIILMDDGFQHRKIYKNLNIILTDKAKLFGNNCVLPLGPLREPICEIKRANSVVFVDKSGIENKNYKKFIEKLTIPYLECKMRSGKIYNIKTGEILDKKEILAFSGIGSPKQFYDNLNDYNLKETIDFDDHTEYTEEILDKIISLADSKNLAIVTTEKDAVKILKYKNADKIYAMKLSVDLDLEKLFKKTLSRI